MKTSRKLILAGASVLIGTILYDRYRGNKPVERDPAIRRHKNRHLNPVFSKTKEKQSTESE